MDQKYSMKFVSTYIKCTDFYIFLKERTLDKYKLEIKRLMRFMSHNRLSHGFMSLKKIYPL